MRYRKSLHISILFLLVLVIGVTVFYIKNEKLNLSTVLEELDLHLIILIITLGVLIFEYLKAVKAYRKRKFFLDNSEFRDIPKFTIDSKKMNFLDKRLSINTKNIDFSSNGTVMLHLNRNNKHLEVKKLWGRKIVKFSDIKFILLEYENYEEFYTIKEILGGTSAYNKEVYINRIIAVLMDDRELKLLETKVHEYNQEKWEEHQISGEYQEKSFLINGKYIIRLLSNFMDKKYFIIDQTEGKASR